MLRQLSSRSDDDWTHRHPPSPCTFFANTQGNGNDGAMRIS